MCGLRCSPATQYRCASNRLPARGMLVSGPRLTFTIGLPIISHGSQNSIFLFCSATLLQRRRIRTIALSLLLEGESMGIAITY
jgi:hypothetical protein